MVFWSLQENGSEIRENCRKRRNAPLISEIKSAMFGFLKMRSPRWAIKQGEY